MEKPKVVESPPPEPVREPVNRTRSSRMMNSYSIDDEVCLSSLEILNGSSKNKQNNKGFKKRKQQGEQRNQISILNRWMTILVEVAERSKIVQERGRNSMRKLDQIQIF